jgi:hypothetical protein
MEYDVWEGVLKHPRSRATIRRLRNGHSGAGCQPAIRAVGLHCHMNWTGQTLPVLLKGWMHKDKTMGDDSSPDDLPYPNGQGDPGR